jgi:hypothetical protein
VVDLDQAMGNGRKTRGGESLGTIDWKTNNTKWLGCGGMKITTTTETLTGVCMTDIRVTTGRYMTAGHNTTGLYFPPGLRGFALPKKT